MLKLALKSLLSMLYRPARMAGRSWLSEMIVRTSRALFALATEMPIEQFRTTLSSLKIGHPSLQKVEFSWQTIAGIDCLVVDPINVAVDSNKSVIYIHGGAYVSGSPNAYKPLLAMTAIDNQVRVIAPKYRLSPEHAMPAAQDDCITVIRYLSTQTPNTKLILMGDSAGGALAINAALACAAADQAIRIDGLMLISPWVEPTAEGGSMQSNQPNDIFSQQFLAPSYAAHIGDADRYDTRVNFLHAELKSLPKSYIQVGGGELFLDQVQAFTLRAKAAGVAIELDVFATQFHDFQVLGPMLDDSKRARVKIAEFIAAV